MNYTTFTIKQKKKKMFDKMKMKLNIDTRIFHDMSRFTPPFALQIDDQTK